MQEGRQRGESGADSRFVLDLGEEEAKLNADLNLFQGTIAAKNMLCSVIQQSCFKPFISAYTGKLSEYI